jgi:hypothetical protein
MLRSALRKVNSGSIGAGNTALVTFSRDGGVQPVSCLPSSELLLPDRRAGCPTIPPAHDSHDSPLSVGPERVVDGAHRHYKRVQSWQHVRALAGTVGYIIGQELQEQPALTLQQCGGRRRLIRRTPALAPVPSTRTAVGLRHWVQKAYLDDGASRAIAHASDRPTRGRRARAPGTTAGLQQAFAPGGVESDCGVGPRLRSGRASTDQRGRIRCCPRCRRQNRLSEAVVGAARYTPGVTSVMDPALRTVA